MSIVHFKQVTVMQNDVAFVVRICVRLFGVALKINVSLDWKLPPKEHYVATMRLVERSVSFSLVRSY